MDYFTEYKLSKYKEIEPLSDKGTTVLVYDTVERELLVKKVVNAEIYKIYKKINDIECDYMPKIIDTIKVEDEYIIIEEFIKGDSVDYLVKQKGAFSEEKAVSYIIDIGEALKQIHSRNIVHRDVTPNNVIIDKNDRAILLDLDIARIEYKNESRDTTLLGTAGFASPEQYGFAETDTRGDIFSMGMLSYFYADLQSGDQKYLAKELYGTSVACLKSWLRCITDLRNRCAHYSRLYYWSFPALPKMPRELEMSPNRKLFSQILVLKLLYPNKKEWINKVLIELKAIVEEYENDISLRHIGFPEDWYEQLEK